MKITETTPLWAREFTVVLSQEQLELLWVATQFVTPESREDGAELESIRTTLAPYLRAREQRAYSTVLIDVNRILRKNNK